MLHIPASLILLVACVSAARFSQELSRVKAPESLSRDFGEQYGSRRSSFQKLLKPDRSANPAKASRGLPIKINDFIYTTNISLGTPPQAFRAVVDLTWTDLFVPSVECGGTRCEEKDQYNSSASSTYLEGGRRKETIYGPIFSYGRESIDTLTLESGIEVPNQHFQEINYYEMVWPDFEVKYFDSVLGLAYDAPLFEDPYSPYFLRSPFRNMIDTDVLDNNVFSLVLPTNDRTGDLTFGAYDETLYEGELIKIPLYPKNTTNWQVEGERLSMVGKDKCGRIGTLFNESLAGYTVMFVTRGPMMYFPSSIANPLLDELNTTYSTCIHTEVIDCHQVATLPTLTITLGGKEFEFKGEDYVLKVVPNTEWGSCEDLEPLCVPAIEGIPDPYAPDYFPEHWAILGSVFLDKFYSAFDWDQRTISFGKFSKQSSGEL